MKTLPIAVAMASCLAFSNVMADDDDDDYKTYHVTITNTTAHHVITPPAVIAHNKHYKLFMVTGTASDGLETMAETGNPGGVLAEANASDYVSSATIKTDDSGAPVLIHPGESITLAVEAPKKTYFTVAAMLATSNDAFTSTTVKAPKKGKYSHGMGMTYDAGTEKNDELCAHIPGPPCAMTSGNGGVDTDGFITIHNGIHGVGDMKLKPANLDWRGPTIMVRVHNAG